jgi:hypothetical protein
MVVTELSCPSRTWSTESRSRANSNRQAELALGAIPLLNSLSSDLRHFHGYASRCLAIRVLLISAMVLQLGKAGQDLLMGKRCCARLHVAIRFVYMYPRTGRPTFQGGSPDQVCFSWTVQATLGLNGGASTFQGRDMDAAQ